MSITFIPVQHYIGLKLSFTVVSSRASWCLKICAPVYLNLSGNHLEWWFFSSVNCIYAVKVCWMASCIVLIWCIFLHVDFLRVAGCRGLRRQTRCCWTSIDFQTLVMSRLRLISGNTFIYCTTWEKISITSLGELGQLCTHSASSVICSFCYKDKFRFVLCSVYT